MPVYEDDTLHGAFKKAIRGTKQQQSSCARFEGEFASSLDELRRRTGEYDRAFRRLESADNTYNQSVGDADAAERLANNATLIDIFTLVPGAVHGIARLLDPGQIREPEKRTWLTGVLRFLENTVFPDRRAEFTRTLRDNAVGSLRTTRQGLARAYENLSAARDRAIQKGERLQSCLTLKPTLTLQGPRGTPMERIRRGMRGTLSGGKKK